MATAAASRLSTLFQAVRSCHALQRPLMRQVVNYNKDRVSHRRCERALGVRWYGDSANKYTHEYYESLLKDKPLVVFMKGEPTVPMCGFSRLVVQILEMHGVKNYEFYDVLEDVDFKEGMKEFSNWPTFPQVYMNGELVGGADIMLQMHQSGELIAEFERIGHRSLLADDDTSL